MGGGIFVKNGSVTMNSGSTISGCTAKNGGSGVCLYNSLGANFNLVGGTISGTIYTYGAGGNSTFTASSGSVTCDTPSKFDKLIVPAGSTLNFNGKIESCSSLDSYIGGGTFEKNSAIPLILVNIKASSVVVLSKVMLLLQVTAE